MDRQDGDRRNLWSDPRVILAAVSSGIGCFQAAIAVCALFVVIFGGILGSYHLLRTQATTSEISNATLDDKLTEIKRQVDDLGKKFDVRDDDVKAVKEANIKQDGKDNQHDDKLKTLESEIATIKVYTSEVPGLIRDVNNLKAKEK